MSASRIRLPGRRRRPQAGELAAAAQVRHRRRLRLPDQHRRLRPAHRQPRPAPCARRGRRLLRRRLQQLPLEPPLDLRARRRPPRLPGGALLRRQRRRAADQPRRPRGSRRGHLAGRSSAPRRSPSPWRCPSTSSATSSGPSRLSLDPPISARLSASQAESGTIPAHPGSGATWVEGIGSGEGMRSGEAGESVGPGWPVAALGRLLRLPAALQPARQLGQAAAQVGLGEASSPAASWIAAPRANVARSRLRPGRPPAGPASHGRRAARTAPTAPRRDPPRRRRRPPPARR